MKTRLLFFSFFILFISITQAQNWAKCITGSYLLQPADDMELDNAGNVYTIGSYSDTTDFDPGPGTCSYIGVYVSCYVSKLDASGNLAWAKSWGNANSVVLGQAIEVDAEENVYISGYYQSLGGDSIDFDPGVGTYYLHPANPSSSYFVMKLDDSGNFVWAINIDGYCNPNNTYNNKIDIALSTDESSLYVSATFKGTVDFDPGAGTYNLTAVVSDPNNGTNVAIIKLDNAGSFILAQNEGELISSDIQVDAADNIYLVSFYFNMIVSKFDSSANIIWQKEVGPHTNGVIPIKMAIDDAGNIYTAGLYAGTVDFDPGAGTYNMTSTGTTSSYITKWDSSGNLTWAISNGSYIGTYGFAFDNSGNIYTTGSYNGSPDFDPGTGTTYLSANGHCFIAKLDASGNLVWVNTLNGSSPNSNGAAGYAIATDASGAIYAIGSFYGTVDFDPGSGTDSIASTNFMNGKDGFILKLDNNGALPISLLSFDVTKRTNDAELAWRTTSEVNTAQFIIERSTDGKVFTSIGHVIAAGNSNALLYYRFIDKQAGILFPNQTVYYRFKQLDRDGKYTYSPMRTILFEKQGVDTRVYPNPATWMISLDVNPALVGSTYTIMNQTGRQVMDGKISALSTSIDMSKLPAGLYMILVGDSKEVLKVMIEQ